MYLRSALRVSLILALASVSSSAVLARDAFLTPSDIVDRMKANFAKMKNYQADFRLEIAENRNSRSSSGKVYYKAGGRLNFTFTNPSGDRIISDGRKMWVYVQRLNAVGIQDLDSSRAPYKSAGYEGLVSLFSRYHYRFDTPEQPKLVNGSMMYVLALDEKTISGGFDKLTVYVDPESYLIRRITGSTASGKKSELSYSNIEVNTDMPNKYFEFKITDNMKVVENPLTLN